MSTSEWQYNVKPGDSLFSRDTGYIWVVKEIGGSMGQDDCYIVMKLCKDNNVVMFCYSYPRFMVTFTPINPIEDCKHNKSKSEELIELLQKELTECRRYLQTAYSDISTFQGNMIKLIDDVGRLQHALAERGMEFDESSKLLKYDYYWYDSEEELSDDDVEKDDDP